MPYSAGYAIADIASLKALSATGLVDGYARWVVAKSSWYGWNSSSTATADDDVIVQITENPTAGRFIRALPSLALAPNIQTEIFKSNPVGYWKLDETSGNIATNYGSGMSNGTYAGDITLGQSPLANGSSYSTTFGNSSKLSFTNTIFNPSSGISFECVVNINSLNKVGSIIYLGSNNNGIGFGIGSSNDFITAGNQLVGIAGNIAWKPSDKSIGLGKHHLGMVYRGATTKEWLFYIDGFLISTLGATQINLSNSDTQGSIRNTLDDVTNSTNQLGLDEVAIYNRELTAREWFNHANAVIY